MKVVLFLDDNENRHKAALETYMGADQTVLLTMSAASTIDALKDDIDWELISLDHDLGGEVYVDSSREDCGMEVVRWMADNPVMAKQIIVHSYNTPAAKEMVLKLKDAGYKNVSHIPFSVVQ